MWLKLLFTLGPEPCKIGSKSSEGRAPNIITGLLSDGDFVGVKVAVKIWHLEYFVWLNLFSLLLNPAPGC